MYQSYKQAVGFFIVYIEEAHASDLFPFRGNVRQGISIPSPQCFDERCALAGECVRDLGIGIPALVDDFKNTVEILYKGWPSRLYLIDRDGRVAYKSVAGPMDPAELQKRLPALAPG